MSNISEEKIVETKTCTHCSVSFDITDKDMEFYDKISPTFDGKKYGVPTPKFCPDCRQQRRLAFRNERKLYKRKCDASGKDIISVYSPDKSYTVYDQDIWWSDNWDAEDFGITYLSGKDFFSQFQELQLKVPRLSLYNIEAENSQYMNTSANNKNCYIGFDMSGCENVYYANWLMDSNNCIDSSYCENCNECYESLYLKNCYKTSFSYNSSSCENVYYMQDCQSCKDCFGCIGLQNKQYYINNIDVGQEAFNKYMKDFFSSENIRKKSAIEAKKTHQAFPHKFSHIESSEGANGDYLLEAMNVHFAYDVMRSRDSKYIFDVSDCSDCYDCYQPGWDACSKLYEVHAGQGLTNSIGLNACRNVHNSFYSDNCFDSSNLFGCIGLRGKQYCILNKQYSREEYEKLVAKIINNMKETGEWGEFFPSNISPFGYHETMAMDYYPLEKEQAIQQGFNWSDYEAPFPKVEKIIPVNKLPESITDIPDDILNWALECELTKKPFRIIPQELEFYRKHNLPIPKRHPDQRHLDRMSLRNPRKLFDRECSKCGCEMKTTYAPDRPEKVYCEECYNKEIY